MSEYFDTTYSVLKRPTRMNDVTCDYMFFFAGLRNPVMLNSYLRLAFILTFSPYRSAILYM